MKSNKGEGRGAEKGGGLIKFFPLKRGGGLIKEGALNRGFTVNRLTFVFFVFYRKHWQVFDIPSTFVAFVQQLCAMKNIYFT